MCSDKGNFLDTPYLVSEADGLLVDCMQGAELPECSTVSQGTPISSQTSLHTINTKEQLHSALQNCKL